jgi:hypothetical protein
VTSSCFKLRPYVYHCRSSLLSSQMSPLCRTISRLSLTARHTVLRLNAISSRGDLFSRSVLVNARHKSHLHLKPTAHEEDSSSPAERQLPEHAVISAFDLFSIGGTRPTVSSITSLAYPVRVKVGPSSSHTVGPMRAAKIFIADLQELGLLEKVCMTHSDFKHSQFTFSR